MENKFWLKLLDIPPKLKKTLLFFCFKFWKSTERSSPSFFLHGHCFFPKNDALLGGEHVCQRHTSAEESLTRDLFTTKRYRKTVDYYSFIFQDLVDEGF